MTPVAIVRRAAPTLAAIVPALLSQAALAQGFDKINTTVTNINTILVTISVGGRDDRDHLGGLQDGSSRSDFLAPAHGRAGGGHGPFPHGKGLGMGGVISSRSIEPVSRPTA